MALQMEARAKGSRQRRAAHQMELFASGAEASGIKPSWLDLPEQVRSTLIGLMSQLIRQHALPNSVTETADDR